MSFLSIIGAFGVAAAILVWTSIAGILNPMVIGVLAVIFVLAGLLFPFYSAHQSRKAEQGTPPTEKK